MRLRSTDHQRLASAAMVVVTLLALGFYVRLRGNTVDFIDTFFGVVIGALAVIVLLYASCQVRLSDGAVVVRNGLRVHRVRIGDIADVTRIGLGTRRAPTPSPGAESSTYLALQLTSGADLVMYGLGHESMLRRQSAGIVSLDPLEAEIRRHCGLAGSGS